MTQPTNPAGPYQMPAATPAAAASGRSVSSAGYWIGGGILVVGCGIAIIWFVVTIVGLIDAPNDFERIAIPGSEVVTLDDGDWVIYYETDTNRFSTVPPSVDVTGPSGREISVGYPSTEYTYDLDGNQGQALYEFRAPTAGAYTIEASTVGEPGFRSADQIAIGRPLFDGSQIGGILGSLALGAVVFLAGLVILIVTIVRRGRAKRIPAMAYGGQSPYGSGPYGGAPYGGPQYGVPPYAAPGPPVPGRPPDPGGWLPPQSPGWGAPPGGPPPPPASPSGWPPPWGAPAAPPAPSAEPPAPAAPSPWTPPGTPGGTGADEPDDDTAPS